MMEFKEYDLKNCERDVFVHKEGIEYWKRRLKTRLDYLNPLIKELQDKGLNLAEISSDLNNEYNGLIMLRNRMAQNN